MTIQILVCTVAERFDRAIGVPLAQREGVSYLFSVQGVSCDARLQMPEALVGRTDVRVLTMPGRGLSANRNHAIAHATGDILMMADDDLTLYPSAFDEIRNVYASDETLDAACFMLDDESGSPLRSYSAEPFAYSDRPRGTYFSSCEISIRHAAFFPPFDERFGLGSEFLACGEEEVFLHEAFRSGRNIKYFPITIGRMPRATTGSRFAVDAGVRRSKGAVLCVMHGRMGAVLRCMKFAFLHCPLRRSVGFFIDMWRGISYIYNKV